MKKRLLGFLSIAGILALCVPAVADSAVVTTTPSVAYVAPADTYDNWTDMTGRNELGFDIAGDLNTDEISDALYLGVDWNHGINNWFAVGVEAGWEGSNFDFNDNNIDIVTVFGDLIARANVPGWSAVPYGVVGLGVINGSSDVATFRSNDTSFAMKFGAGVDWFLTRNWILNFEVSYIATGGDLPASNGSTQGLDHWRVGGGLKYAF